MNIDQFSDDELKAELNKREEQRRQEELAERNRRAEFWLSKIKLLLELVPEHSRTSCSDGNAINDERCTRCYLLCAESCNIWDYDRQLDISISKLKSL